VTNWDLTLATEHAILNGEHLMKVQDYLDGKTEREIAIYYQGTIHFMEFSAERNNLTYHISGLMNKTVPTP